MDLDGWGTVLDELNKHWEVSEFTCVANYQLNLLEDLQNIYQEELGSFICWQFLNRSGGNLLNNYLLCPDCYSSRTLTMAL